MPVLALAGGAVILLLILLLLASPSFRSAMHDTIAGLPLIGGWLADNNERLISFLYVRLAVWANSALGALSNLIETLASLEYQFASQLENLASAMHESMSHLRSVVIPAAQAAAEAHAEARLAYVGAGLQAGINATGALARQLYVGAIRYSQTEYLQATAYAQRLGLWAAARADQLWVSATTYARGLTLQAELEAQGREARAEALGRVEAAAGRALTAQALGAAEAYAELWGRRDQAYAEALNGSALRHADLGDARTLGLAAGLIGGVAVAVRAIEDSACMQQCETLGNLGRELSALDLGAILALVEMAAQNPHGTAQFIQRELAPIVRANAELVRGLV